MTVFSPHQESSLVAFLLVFFCPIFLTYFVFLVAHDALNKKGKGKKRKVMDNIETNLQTSAQNLENLESQPPNTQQSQPPNTQQSQPPDPEEITLRIHWKSCDEFLAQCLLRYQSYCYSKKKEYSTNSKFCARWIQPMMAKEHQDGPYWIKFGSINGAPSGVSARSKAKKDYTVALNRIQNHVSQQRLKFMDERTKHTASGSDPSTMPHYALWEQIWPQGTTSGDPHPAGRSTLLDPVHQSLMEQRIARNASATATGPTSTPPRSPAGSTDSTASPSTSTPNSPSDSYSILVSQASQAVSSSQAPQAVSSSQALTLHDNSSQVRICLNQQYQEDHVERLIKVEPTEDDGLALNVSTEADAFDIPPCFNTGPIRTNLTPSKFAPLNPSNKSVKFSVEKLREMLNAPCPVSKVPVSVRPVPKVPVSVTEPEEEVVMENVVDDGEIASGSGNYLADNPAVLKLIKQTEAMNKNDLKEEAENRKIKNLTKETTKTALKNRQLDDAKADSALRAAAHSDLTTYHRHVQDSDRVQLQNQADFNKIFQDIELKKIDLQREIHRDKMAMEKERIDMQREAENADLELRERELRERRDWRMTIAKYMATGKYPRPDDSLRSQVFETQNPPLPLTSIFRRSTLMIMIVIMLMYCSVPTRNERERRTRMREREGHTDRQKETSREINRETD